MSEISTHIKSSTFSMCVLISDKSLSVYSLSEGRCCFSPLTTQETLYSSLPHLYFSGPCRASPPPLAPPPPKFNCAHGNVIDRASKFKKACSCYDHFDSKTTNNTIFFFEMMSEKLEQPLKATHSMDYKSKSRQMSSFFPSFN